MEKHTDIKIGHCLNSYKDIGYNWEVIELENENSSRVYFSKEDEKLMDENLKKKEFLERLEELKMSFQKFKDCHRKYYQGIKIDLENLNDILVFCGKKNRIDLEIMKKDFLEKGYFTMNFNSNDETQKIYLGNYIVREKVAGNYYFKVFNEKEFFEKYQELERKDKNENE